MNDFQKVLVVDTGDRLAEDLLSAQLAELGFSSVTTSFEAADEVLGVIQTPSAIVVKMPAPTRTADRERLLAVVETLRSRGTEAGVPVILWERDDERVGGGLSGVLASTLGPHALHTPPV